MSTIVLIKKPDGPLKDMYSYHHFVVNADLDIIRALTLGNYDFEKHTLGLAPGYFEAEKIIKSYCSEKFPIKTETEVENSRG
jgi:hypothetical protein